MVRAADLSIARSIAASSPACPSAWRWRSGNGAFGISRSTASPSSAATIRASPSRSAASRSRTRSSCRRCTTTPRSFAGRWASASARSRPRASRGTPVPGIREPNLVRIETAEGPGLVNCNGFKNPGLEAYRRALAALPHRVPLIVAAAGESADEYARVVAGLEAVRRSRRDQHLVAEHQAGLRVVVAARRARRALSRRPRRHREADHRQGLARFPRHERGAHHPRRARRGHHHRELRQHAPRGRAAPLAAHGRPVGPGAVPRRRSTTCAGFATDSATQLQIIATGGIDAPDKAREALDAGATACAYFTGFITRGPVLARASSSTISLLRAPSVPRVIPRLSTYPQASTTRNLHAPVRASRATTPKI